MRKSIRDMVKKLRVGAGFTMSEVLIVVAILAVLSAVAIPGFIALRRNLIITRLDDTAKEMYVAAQNTMTRLSNSDSLAKLEGAAITAEPSDFNGANWSVAKDNMFYGTQDSDAAKLLLPVGAIDDSVTSGAYYVIEYNKKTASIYSVFYAENSFVYSQLSNNDDFRLSRDARKALQVGYYGGASVDRDDFGRCATPIITVENDDVLKLSVTGGEAGYTMRAVLRDKAGNNAELKSSDLNSLIVRNADSSFSLTMDSLTGERFHSLFPALNPGDDIDVTVYFEKSDPLNPCLSSFSSTTVNSLFASRNGAEVSLNCARHLQNLDFQWSGLVSGITSAKQLGHIRWNAAQALNSIDNTSLVSYDGNNRQIIGLTGSNGLFGSLRGAALTDIIIVNPKINSTSASTGALAGELVNCSVSGCQVYAYELSDRVVNYAGYTAYGISATGTVGGLVGTMSGGSVDGSFAALPHIYSGGNSAGLIGSATSCTISDSYSACDELTNATAMFIASAAGSSVTNCYAVGNCSTTDTALPFVPGGAVIADSYCAFSYIMNEVKRAPTSYLVVDGATAQSSADTLNNDVAGGTWGSSSAAMTRPYSQTLDGRAYPFKSIPGLRHFGSWPLEGGIVVTVDFLLDTGVDGADAGQIVVYDEKGTTALYISDNPNLSGPFEVPVGESITVVVEANPGYTYLYSDVTGATGRVNSQRFTFKPLSDTTVSAVYRQMAFPLRCEAVTYAQTNNGGTYRVYVGSSGSSASMLPGSTRNVYSDSAVIVVPDNRDNLYVASVWYTYDDSSGNEIRSDVYRDENGEFSFTMPAAPSSLHVMYTKKFATYNIYYHRQNVDGVWPATGTFYKQELLGIGEVINSDYVNHFADISNIAVTIGGEPCIYYDPAQTQLLREGQEASLPYTSENNDSNKSFEIHIYFSRATYDVTLVSGENINSVQLSDTAANSSSVTSTYYYGKNVTATASVFGNNTFTEWAETSNKFAGSTDSIYSFAVPSYDITLKASAIPGTRRISLRIFKDGDSWLLHGQNIYLQNIDTKQNYLMSNLDTPTNSFLSEKSVPAGRYHVMFSNGEYYTLGGQYYLSTNHQVDDRLVLDCTHRSVEDRLDFYTVTYYPNCSRSYGSVPDTEIHPGHHIFVVPGNSGALRRTDDHINDVFCGWYDSYVPSMDRGTFDEGDTFSLIRRTSLFAIWQEGLNITYDANGADSGSLPYDSRIYLSGDSVTVKYPEENNPLIRNGYNFIGWFEDSNNSGNPDPDVGDIIHNTPTNNETVVLSFSGVNIRLLAHWVPKQFPITRYDSSGNSIGSETVTYQQSYTMPYYSPQSGTFVGWATEPNGAVKYRAGDSVSVGTALNLYARIADETVTISYMKLNAGFSNRYHVDSSIVVGKNIPFYIDSGSPVIAWSEADDRQNGSNYYTNDFTGSPYYCDDNGFGLYSVSFSVNTRLYPISDKVYNSEKGTWYSTLKAAVDNASNNNTLVVYGNTLENGQIDISKPLNIIANGNRTISWENSRNIGVNNSGYNLTSGCLSISSVVCLGAYSIDGNEMGSGNSLVFDAAGKGRVICLQNGSSLYMYDGVTLTNGVPGGNTNVSFNSAVNFWYYGGGVYASPNSNFYMRGGTVSYCSAYIGGGVYLYTGSHMEMGRMLNPGSIGQGYMDGGTYYKQVGSGSTMYYELDTTVTAESYASSFVPYGYPQIIFNNSFRTAGLTTSDPAGDGGGGLFLRDLAQNGILLYSGEISFNSSNANGGGIVTDSEGNGVKLRIYNVEICDNVANNGGAIFQWQGTVYVYNSNLSRNYARNNGGGIYLNRGGSETSNLEFHYGDIIGNQAQNLGGAVYVENGADIIMTGGNLLSNSAVGGGGAYLESGGDFKLSGGYISGNAPDDAYLNASRNASTGRINVPAGGLNTNRPLHTSDDDRVVLACSNPSDGLVVVGYENTADFVDTDANYFWYIDSDYSVLPSTRRNLVLGEDSDIRTVTFYENRGTSGSATVSHDYAFGETPTVLSIDDLNAIADEMSLRNLVGYKFIGWATRSDATAGEVLSQYEVSNLYGQTLYAVWDFFKVTYDVSNAPSSVLTPAIANGPTVTLPTPDVSGGGAIVDYNTDNTLEYTYSFLGWSATAQSTTVDAGRRAGDVIENLAEDITLYSVWELHETASHNISFDPNGATGNVLTVRVSRGLSVSATRASFSRTGHELVSWNTVRNPSAQNPGISYLPDDVISMADADITLYAQWQPSVYSVSFHANDGSANDLLQKEDAAYGEALIFPVDPSREHHSFLGWAEAADASVALYDPANADGYLVIDNMTLYAVWELDHYTVSFNPNTGVGGVPSQSIGWGESGTLPAAQSGISKPDYVLTGWNTAADASGLALSPESAFSFGGGGADDLAAYADSDRALTLYAQWTAQHTLTFNTDGGSPVPEAQAVLEGAEIILPADPTKANFEFAGWSDSLGGIALSEPINMGNSDLTLYALWTPVDPLQPLP